MSLTIKKVLLKSADLGGESTLPSISNVSNVQQLTQSYLDEDDELFVGYGRLASIFPYKMQDLYDRGSEPKEYMTVELENDHLKAVFMPQLGGKLWSLYDKDRGEDLLFTNDIVRPCNLAVRNAWMSGGIEFNCGMIGHHPFTCSPLFTAVTQLEDGTPVLRMYEYERVREVVYQMDFFLPDDSKVLLARMRIVNPGREVIPMYWWSNIAVPYNDDARNIIDATETYNNKNGAVGKNPVPFYQGIDITYPANNPIAIDYFWKIPQNSRKYTSYIYPDGYGFVQTSTSRLQGRKLFVWGQGDGGRHWQSFLTSDGNEGKYFEIQAGLAHTQYECIPMPPLTAWEWMEAYGSIQVDKDKAFGEWTEARKEVGRCLEDKISEKYLEELLAETRKMALAPAKELILSGSGWGALENIRRGYQNLPCICPHLDFGSIGSDQVPWKDLLDKKTLKGTSGANDIPVSWMLGDSWLGLIEDSEDCREKYIHLAVIYIAMCLPEKAKMALDRALEYGKSPIILFAQAQLYRIKGDEENAAWVALEAQKEMPLDISLARQAFTLAYRAGKYEEIIAAYDKSGECVKADGRVRMFLAGALLNKGNIQRAEEELIKGGGLVVADIREGEISLTNLYIDICRAKAEKEGREFIPEEVEVPEKFDFRMSVPKGRKSKD